MSQIDWLFLLGVIQAIGSTCAILEFFGVTPKTLKNSRWGVMLTDRSKFKWIAIVLAMGSFVFSGTGWYRCSQIRVVHFPKGQKAQEVSHRTFVNEPVVLDGFSYTDCTFDHVSFVYQGTAAPGSFEHNTINGPVHITTENHAVFATVEILKGLGQLRPDFRLTTGLEHEEVKTVEPPEPK